MFCFDAAAGPVIEMIEVEVQVGEKAAEKIIKVINMSEEEEIQEDKNVLLKLQKILVPGLKNSTRSSSSSSSLEVSSLFLLTFLHCIHLTLQTVYTTAVK